MQVAMQVTVQVGRGRLGLGVDFKLYDWQDDHFVMVRDGQTTTDLIKGEQL